MGASQQNASIFSHKLDRVAFIAYFLGAVVPLLALAVVVERFVLPELADTISTLGLIGLVVSIAVLSLGSFLTLRRTTRVALQRMDRDNHRLESLLAVSRSLATAQHGGHAATIAAASALELTGARAIFVMVRGEGAEEPELLEAIGDSSHKLYQSLAKAIGELAVQAMGEGRAAICGPGEAAPGAALPGIAAAVVPLAGESEPFGAIVAIHTRPDARFDGAQLDGLSTLAGLASVALRNADLRDIQRNFFTHVTEMLVNALDSHLEYHMGHGTRVAHYANRIGRDLGLGEKEMQQLHFGALLHDIGMLKLDRAMQQSSKACAQHPSLGFRMLNQIRLWRDIAPLVHHHHERFDGSGYPEGLAGDEIPFLARIIAVCEAFDSMTSRTSYKAAVPFDEAVAEIVRGAGTQFDPDVVRTFRSLVDRGVIAPDGD